MPHKQLQELSVIDYTKNTVVVAVMPREEREIIVGVGQYQLYGEELKAEAAIAVRDEYQNHGIGTELMSYLTYLAKRQGLTSFTADVLVENQPMLHLFEKVGFDIERRSEEGIYQMTLNFRE
jgi:ribosomal protein S18 acetylase RimI-like enzyme